MFIVLTIGKVVFTLFLVLLCILAVFLFFPVSYLLNFDIDKKSVDFKVNWLFGLVRFHFCFREKMEAVLSILFFKMDFTDPEARKKRQERKKKKEAAKFARRKKKNIKKQKKRDYSKENPSEIIIGSEGKVTSSNTPHNQSGDKENKSDPEHGTRKFPQIWGSLQKSLGMLNLIREQEIVPMFWPKVLRFLTRVRPRKLNGQICFGLGDPAKTGMTVGAIAMIPWFYTTELVLCPDFETEEVCFSGHIFCRGHMLLVHMVILVVDLIRQKKIRKLIGLARKKG